MKVRHLQSSGGNHQQQLQRVARWLQQHPCDVVHLPDWPDLISDLRKALHPHPPQLIVGLCDAGKETAQQRGPAETWPIELSWQAFHERLPRRVAEAAANGAEEAKATAGPEDSAPSTWRRLIKRIRRT